VDACLACAPRHNRNDLYADALAYQSTLDRVCPSPHTHQCSFDCARAETIADNAGRDADRPCTGFCASTICDGMDRTHAANAFAACSLCINKASYPASMQSALVSYSSLWEGVCTAYSAEASSASSADFASRASVASSQSAAWESRVGASATASARGAPGPAQTQSPGMLAAAALVGALVL
jgi:hypothetical protein